MSLDDAPALPPAPAPCFVCGKAYDGRRWETYSNRPGDNRPVCPECVLEAINDVLEAMRNLPPEAWEESGGRDNPRP